MSKLVLIPRLRRNLQQVVHCAQEALSVVENDEPEIHAIDDLVQAQGLIEDVLYRLRAARRDES